MFCENSMPCNEVVHLLNARNTSKSVVLNYNVLLLTRNVTVFHIVRFKLTYFVLNHFTGCNIPCIENRLGGSNLDLVFVLL